MRLTSWGRVQLRLWSARGDREADEANPPVVGFLIPDLLEHALEVYDHDGVALGQLVSDPPASGAPPEVRFERHPWHPQPIANPLLNSFVEGIEHAARTERPARTEQPRDLHESALTAMMRVIDTLRATVDTTGKHGDHKLRMLGAPIAIVRAKLWFERTAAVTQSSEPPPLADALTLTAKVGTANQPDDGVLGCFIPASAPGGDDAHFRPVDRAALKGTLVNGLTADGSVAGMDAVHRFVHDPAGADTTFQLTGSEERELLLVLDMNGGLYVTTGVLPRKRISVPTELWAGAQRRFEPSFCVGPLLGVRRGAVTGALLPTPSVPGYEARWTEQGTTEAVAISPLPSDGDLPEKRVSITQGWIRLVHAD
jgi:hypothetical protein